MLTSVLALAPLYDFSEVFAQTSDDITDITSYVIYGLEKVEIDKGVTIQSGNIGIHDDSKKKGELKIKKGIEFIDPNSSVVANKIKIEKNAVAPNVFYNELKNKGTILGTENTPLNLPVVNNLSEFPDFEVGDEKIKVDKNESVILPPGDYGKIELKKKSMLIFEGGEYNIESLKADKDSQILFEDSSEIRVEKDVILDKLVTLGPHPDSEIEASDIIFFVGDGKKKSKIEFGKSSMIYANFYSPDGEIKMKKETHATGSFIAKKIQIEKDVNLTLNSSGDIPIGDLVSEYLALIKKLDGIGSSIDQTIVTQELIGEINDDLDRIKQIVIELQMRGFDGESTASRINGQTVGNVLFFDENNGDELFSIDIPNGTLGLFIIFGLIEEFENTSGEFTLDEQIGMIEESLEFSFAIINFDDETIASNFVLSAIGAYHPSTGDTFFIPIAIFLLRIAFQECILSGACEIIATFAAQFIIGEVLPQAFPTIGIAVFNFNDIDGDGEFMESDINFPLEGFEFTLDSKNSQIITPSPETSGSDGFLRFTTIIPRIDTTFAVIQTPQNGWIPTTQESFSQPIDVSFTSDTITLVPEGLTFGNLRTPGILNVEFVINELGGNIAPENFTVEITNNPNVSPDSFPGSSTGTQVIMDPGAYQVTISPNVVIGLFNDSVSSECSSRVNGIEVNPIGPDETRTCIITIDDLTPEPATLIVIKKVTNDGIGNSPSGAFDLQVTQPGEDPILFSGVDGDPGTPGSPGTPGTPTSQVLIYDDFSSGLDGWSYFSFLSSNPRFTFVDNYSLSVTGSDGQPSPSAHVSGDGFVVTAGMKKDVLIPADATQVVLTFDGRAHGTLPSHNLIPNLRLHLFDDSEQVIYTENIVGPPDNIASVSLTDWETFSVDITEHVSGHENVGIFLGLTDPWRSNWGLKIWIDNVKLESLSPGGPGIPSTPGIPPTGGVEITLQPGSYSVTEDIPIEYTVSYSDECSGTIESGDTKVCVVTNDDRQELVRTVFEDDFNDGILDGWIGGGSCSGGTCIAEVSNGRAVIGVRDSSPTSSGCFNQGSNTVHQSFDVVIPGDYNLRADLTLASNHFTVNSISFPGFSFSERGIFVGSGADTSRIIDEVVHLNPGTYQISISASFSNICVGTLITVVDNISVTLVE